MSLFKKFVQSLQRSKQREALAYLQSMTPRQLDDCGFSPELIAKGVKAWPWRIDNTASEQLALSKKLRDEKKAVQQLQRYSDAELSDLGICRGSILDAVRNGRPGIDRHVNDEAA